MLDVDDKTKWVMTLKPGLLSFLDKLREGCKPGYYKYSLTGDIYKDDKNWGLGNAVFASKILYMIGGLSSRNMEDLAKFIMSFQSSEGYIYDPLVEKLSFSRRVKHAVCNMDVSKLSNEPSRRAESRQAFAALKALGYSPKRPYENIPHTKKEINEYIDRLDWKYPWASASHISHLIFFLKNNQDIFNLYGESAKELISNVFEKMNVYKRRDGAWYCPNSEVAITEKVNGAMKMMTAYDAAGRNDFHDPEKLIDLCLSALSKGNACNNFNVICVLYHCSRMTSHRAGEIKEYCLTKLVDYKKHYWPEFGGFSFNERNANDVYYGARISRGLPEPDIHGTALFLWGISLILRILQMEDKVGLLIPIT
jgi:hypothetical protein